MADPDLDVVEAGLVQGPVGEPDHLGVGGRAGGAEQFDADLGELAVMAGLRVLLEPEDRPGHAHPPRQGGGSAASV